MTVTGGAVVVALISAGAVAVVRLESHRTRAGSAVAPAACAASQLQGTLLLDSMNFHLVGSVEVTNAGDRACTLEGQPSVAIVDRNGAYVAVDEGLVDPWWRTREQPKPKGWPVVTLAPGGTARLHIVWDSWCGRSETPAGWRVWLRGAGSVDIPDSRGQAPSCSGLSSKVQVGPFEPVS